MGVTVLGIQHKVGISIHALLAESDYNCNQERLNLNTISIHALLAESDLCVFWQKQKYGNFYPRSPCGERQLLTLTT